MSYVKRFILLLLLLPICAGQIVNEMNTNIYILENGETNIEISLLSSKIRQIDIPVYTDIYNLKSENASCIITSGVQKIIQCKPESDRIKIAYSSKEMVKATSDISFFSYDMPIMWTTKHIAIRLELPLGYALTDKVLVPVSPPNTEVGTDGRKIFIKWEFSNKEQEDIIPLRVYYEKAGQSSAPRFYGIMIAVSVSALTILAVFYLRVVKKKPELVLSVLNEAERIVVEILQNQPEEEVDQRKIVALSGFSKAKVSRIIHSLEERGVVETIRLGRKNKVILKKKFVKEETEQSEK
jgi:uncharacterized membrane protein